MTVGRAMAKARIAHDRLFCMLGIFEKEKELRGIILYEKKSGQHGRSIGRLVVSRKVVDIECPREWSGIRFI